MLLHSTYCIMYFFFVNMLTHKISNFILPVILCNFAVSFYQEKTPRASKAAKYSKNNARHWFRYLRKYINKCGTSFTKYDVENLYRNDALTPFQRVSIKAAFEDGTQTRLHIIGLNQKIKPDKIASVRAKYEKSKSHE